MYWNSFACVLKWQTRCDNANIKWLLFFETGTVLLLFQSSIERDREKGKVEHECMRGVCVLKSICGRWAELLRDLRHPHPVVFIQNFFISSILVRELGFLVQCKPALRIRWWCIHLQLGKWAADFVLYHRRCRSQSEFSHVVVTVLGYTERLCEISLQTNQRKWISSKTEKERSAQTSTLFPILLRLDVELDMCNKIRWNNTLEEENGNLIGFKI